MCMKNQTICIIMKIYFKKKKDKKALEIIPKVQKMLHNSQP